MAEDTMREILEQTRKEAFFSRLMAMFMAGILIVLVAAALILVPRAVNMMTEIEKTAQDAQGVIVRATETLDSLKDAMDGVDGMTQSITRTSMTLFEGIEKVNFDVLSGAITDLQAAVESLAGFARMFGW